MFAVRQASGLTLLHPERPKLYAILAFLSAIGSVVMVRVQKFIFSLPLGK